MEVSKAKEELLDIIKIYAQKIAETGVKCVADVYYSDKNGLAVSKEPEDISDSLCGSITIFAEDADDENGKCGFDIILPFDKDNEIEKTKMDDALSEFSADVDTFIDILSSSEDKNSFIKSESEKQKAEISKKMEKFNKDMKKLQILSVCMFLIVMLIVLTGIFAMIS